MLITVAAPLPGVFYDLPVSLYFMWTVLLLVCCVWIPTTAYKMFGLRGAQKLRERMAAEATAKSSWSGQAGLSFTTTSSGGSTYSSAGSSSLSSSSPAPKKKSSEDFTSSRKRRAYDEEESVVWGV